MLRHSQLSIRRALLALALTLSVGKVQAANIAPLEQELDGVRKALEFGRAAEELRRQEAEKANAEVKALQNKLVAAAAKSRELEKAVAAAEERLSGLLVRSEAARYRLQGREEEIAATLKAMVRLQRQPPIALLLHNDTMIGAARSNRLLARAVPQLRDDTASLRHELAALASLRRETEAERERLDEAVAALSQQRATTTAMLQKRKAQVRELAGDSRSERQRLEKLASRAKSLSALLTRLHEEEARRKRDNERRARLAAAEQARREAERAAAERAAAELAAADRAASEAAARAKAEAAASAQRRVAAASPSTVTARLSFSQARGRLTLPVHGRIIRKFGDRDDIGSRSQGLTLLTRATAEVVAPHDGHIAFSGPFRDYGVILIIAHGEGYHTLLAGLAETYVDVGQALLAGEPVGHMGDGKNRTLYVELRRNGEAINPHPWWASNGGKVSG